MQTVSKTIWEMAQVKELKTLCTEDNKLLRKLRCWLGSKTAASQWERWKPERRVLSWGKMLKLCINTVQH